MVNGRKGLMARNLQHSSSRHRFRRNSGWFNDSYRHVLARHGVKTGRRVRRPASGFLFIGDKFIPGVGPVRYAAKKSSLTDLDREFVEYMDEIGGMDSGNEIRAVMDEFAEDYTDFGLSREEALMRLRKLLPKSSVAFEKVVSSDDDPDRYFAEKIGLKDGDFEALRGGLAEGMSDEKFDPRQLTIGQRVEMEHTVYPEIAKRISKDHLVEHPQYYDELFKAFPAERKAHGVDSSSSGFGFKDVFRSPFEVIGVVRKDLGDWSVWRNNRE
jgi:hypothetical protein